MRLACEKVRQLWPPPGKEAEVDTDFRIVKYRPVKGSEHTDIFVAKGNALPTDDFFDIVLEGKFVNDEKYGPTFIVKSFTTTVRKTRANVLGYLASGIIKGVGAANAKKIVDHFGVNAIEILERNPERLKEVSGIGDKVLEDITESFQANREINGLMLYIGQFYRADSDLAEDKCPLTPKKARRVVDYFGNRALDVIKNDVFNLCEVPGFGFKSVDTIAMRMKHPMHTLPRVQACAIYVLNENRSSGGHLCMQPDGYLKALKQNLNHKNVPKRLHIDESVLRPLANETLKSNKIVYIKGSIYLRKDFVNELGFATILAQRLFNDKYRPEALPHPTIVDCGFTLAPEQEKAVYTALTGNTAVITGGPGTGKTTVLKSFLDSYKRMYPDKDGIILCAPTGRAAKRMSEATGCPAYTAHKAFGLWSEDEGDTDADPRDIDLVVIDESSMVDMWLAYQIISRISLQTKLIFVGDAAQLPSVGPGNVLHEVIRCGLVPVVELEQVFRQADGSSIAINAKRIKKVETDLVYDNDFFFLAAANQTEAMSFVGALYKKAAEVYGRDRVQILTPMRKKGHACGVHNLNREIQRLIQGEPELGYRHYENYYCNGDPVIQNKNEGGINNGDLGEIQEVTPENVRVLYPGADDLQQYDDERLNILELAYALTVHKSQGSEYSIVIFPVLKEHSFMLTRNLLYTAITRGKVRVFLVGSKWALKKAIRTEDSGKRLTHLAEWICEEFYKLEREYHAETGMVREAV